MRSSYVRCLGSRGFRRVHYTDWGDADNDRVLVCVHGLTRNSRDFDMLASALADSYRIVCPDIPGRGLSDWLPSPEDYGYPCYLSDMAVLLASLHIDRVAWLGTSLGGLVGMLIAAQANTPLRRLLMNDVGPFVSQAALDRLCTYVGKASYFRDLDALEAHCRAIYAPFGQLSDEQWRHLAVHSAKRLPSGEYALHYDPAIGTALRQNASAPIDLWDVWDAVRCPVTVFRGAESDVLLPEIAAEMQSRGPKAELVEFAGVGHAPALMADDQIAAVREWLLS